DDANQLALRVWMLQVQSSERAAGRARLIVLHERTADAVAAIAVRVKRFDEKAAAVAMDVRLDDDDAWEFRGNDLHVSSRVREDGVSTGRTRSRPSRARAASARTRKCTPSGRRFPRGTRPSVPAALRSRGCNE